MNDITNITLHIDGEAQDCSVVTDANGEYVCTTIIPEGSEEPVRFIKFPEGDLLSMVAEHNEANPLSE